MSNNNSTLFQPLQIGNLTLNNRIVMAPLTRSRAGPSRCANELMEEYYSQRNTAGLIITEGTHISDQAIGWNNSPAIYSKEHVESWKKLVSEFKIKSDNKTPIFLQLWHCGRHSHTNFHADNRIPVGPSSISLLGVIDTPIGKLPTQTPYSLSVEEISDIIKDYKLAAEKAKEAGFHGVEIHSADGYLLDSFLQSKTNHRSDIYGGSFENRFRLLKQVIEAISEIFPTDRIGVKLSPNGVTNEMGSLDYKDSFTYYFQELSKLNLAYLHVVDGLGFGFHNLGNPITLNYIRQHYKGRIIGNCGHDFKSANQAIESGNADLISFGRLFMANPDLVERFRNDWPLNKEVPLSAWYAGGAVGYTDSPFYSPNNNNNNNLINSKDSKINKNIGEITAHNYNT